MYKLSMCLCFVCGFRKAFPQNMQIHIIYIALACRHDIPGQSVCFGSGTGTIPKVSPRKKIQSPTL